MASESGSETQCFLGLFLANNYGKHVSRSDFDAAVAKAWGDNSVKAVKLTCNGNPAYLTEMQVAIDARAINEPTFREIPAGATASG